MDPDSSIFNSSIDPARSDPSGFHQRSAATSTHILNCTDSDISIDDSFTSSTSTSISLDTSISSISTNSSPRSPSPVASRDQLEFYYTNATSLKKTSCNCWRHKLHLLAAQAAAVLTSIIAISETWFDDKATAELTGYQLFRSDRQGGRAGGGVCVYVRDEIQASEVHDHNLLLNERMLMLLLGISTLFIHSA
jgi:hypothetical protein